MNKEILLNELFAQTITEKNINDEMQKEIDFANQLIDDIKNGWNVFIKEAFPEEVVSVMSRFNINGNKLINTSGYSSANCILPIISVGNLHIAFIKNSLVFVQEQKTIGFFYYNRGTYEYGKNGMFSWNSYPVTFWENLPYKFSLNTSKQGMIENRKTIDLVYDFNKMLTDFQENLSEIYTEIARLNAEYVKEKRNTLSVKQKAIQNQKKYKVTIEIEEI